MIQGQAFKCASMFIPVTEKLKKKVNSGFVTTKATNEQQTHQFLLDSTDLKKKVENPQTLSIQTLVDTVL